MKTVRSFFAFVLLSVAALATAQTAPSGTYYAPGLELQFSFAPQPSGEIIGALIGGITETPIHYVGDGIAYHGHFTVENYTFGITAQLAESGVLNLWLYEFDSNGVPVEASYEWYEAELVRAATNTPPRPPAQQQQQNVAGNRSNDLLGVWQSFSMINDMQVSHVVYFDQSGMFEHGVYDMYGQLISAMAGTWSFDGNRLEQYVTDYLPQMCIYGSCQPFHLPDAERASTSTISFQNGGFTLVSATTGSTLVYSAGVNLPATPPPAAMMPNTGPMYNYPATGGMYTPPAYTGMEEFGGGFAGGGLSPPGENEHARWINTVIYENYELDDYY